MSNWIDTNYVKTDLNDHIIMSEPLSWSVACRYPAEGTVKALYYFQDYTQFSSNINPVDDVVVASEAGKQEVVIPFYEQQHEFVLNMVSSPNVSDYTNLAYYRAEKFLRSVRRLTEDTDENWSVVFRFTDLQSGGREAVIEIVGKILASNIIYNPRSHKNLVQVGISVVEDNENDNAPASTRWYESSYYETTSTLDSNLVMTEPSVWSLSCRYPFSGSSSVHYFFRGFQSFGSNLTSVDQAIVAFEEGGQEVVIPFYQQEHRFSVQMISGDDSTGVAASWDDVALFRAERFLRSIRRLTEDTDKNWEIVFRYTDLTFTKPLSPRAILAGDTASSKEPVLRMLGKIRDATINVQSFEQNRIVQVDFTFIEDTEI